MADPSESDLSGKLGVGAGIPLVKKCVLRDCSWKMAGGLGSKKVCYKGGDP